MVWDQWNLLHSTRFSGQTTNYPTRNLLAPISGSVEASDAAPLDAAWREIEEETTLTRRSLELLRQGEPYFSVDASVGREWALYPFAFRLKRLSEGGLGTSGIKIGWEHQSYHWFDPRHVTDSESFGGVPRLTESLRRCWLEAGS